MTIFQDPFGAMQSYMAAGISLVVNATNSGTWTAVIAVMAALVLGIRLYKEVKELFTKKG